MFSDLDLKTDKMSGLWNSQYKLVQKSLNRDLSGLLQNLEMIQKVVIDDIGWKSIVFAIKMPRALRARGFFLIKGFLIKRRKFKNLRVRRKNLIFRVLLSVLLDQ